jgi:CheY-like chemotaxis protein
LQPATGKYVEEKYGWNSAGHYVHLAIADDGIGIPEDVRRRIFDPFFTTKGVGKGTGLGLSIVHGIVNAHNGVIDVESTEGAGTTFHVFLPAIEHQAIKDSLDQIEHARGRGETILLVEDEIMLRDLLTEFLVRAGYSVIEAGDGEEGIAMYRAHANSIDLVLSDIGLPKLGGEQVFGAIRKINPAAKVVFCTGFIEEAKREMLLEAGAMNIVQKPYKVPEVLSAVREALNRP